jgi:putative ABC transport system permease protein
MTFLAVIFKNVLRRRARSVLTALGVALAVGAVVALVGFSRGFAKSAAEVYAGHDVDLVVVRSGVTERLTSSLDENIGDRLAELSGVKNVNPSLTDMVSFGEGSLVGIPVHGWPPDSAAFQSLSVNSGRAIDKNDRRVVMLGQSLATSLNKKVGDTVEIEMQPFQAIGVYQGANVLENITATVPLADLQELMDRPGQVTEFQIVLEPPVRADPTAIEKLRREIADLRGAGNAKLGLSAVPTQQYITSSTEIRLARAMARVTTGLALLIGSIGMLNTMIMSVLERTQEIGVLRAIGWRKSRVVRMVLGESLLICTAGATVGVLAGWLMIRGLSRLPLLQGVVRPELSVRVVIEGCLLALVVGLVGGSYPAWRGARMEPAEALHYE